MSADPAERLPQGTAEDRHLATSIAEILELEYLESGAYVAVPGNLPTSHGIYGGRVAAQALRAAAHTVPADRVAHSMHSYFLRPGDVSEPLVLQVHLDRDGGTFSTRRVVASQNGEAIFTLIASFHQAESGPEFQGATIPPAQDPEELPPVRLARWSLDLEARIPPTPGTFHRWPTRLWIRVKDQLPDDANTHACALLFISDMCTGLARAPRVEETGLLPSLDHSLWLHRPACANDWMLMDLVPEVTSNGRGMYSGRMFRQDGTLVATLAQESLFRVR